VIKELHEPADVICAINNMENPLEKYEKLHKPSSMTKEAKTDLDAVDLMILQEKFKDYHKGGKLIISNMKKIYAYVWGQCTQALQGAIKMEKDYKEKSGSFDVMWILERIKERLCGVNKNQNVPMAIRESLMQLLTLKQYDDESNSSFLSRFESTKESFNLIAGKNMLCNEKIMGKNWNESPGDEFIESAIDEFLAACFLASSNNNRFGKLKESLKERENLGSDEYPKTISDTFELIMKTSGELESRKGNSTPRFGNNLHGHGGTNVYFAQYSENSDVK